jgi:transcription elongation factor Elf1
MTDDGQTLACPRCGSEYFGNVDAYDDMFPFWTCSSCGHEWELSDADANAMLNRVFPSPGSMDDLLERWEREMHTGTNDSV